MTRPLRSRILTLALATLAFGLRSHVALAADDARSDDPAVERQLLQLPEGFDIQLYASEPEVINPITIDFDAQGRCWALCLPRYPQMLAGQAPSDYIEILGKPDENGHATSHQTFFKGLTIPTGMTLGSGGVYVGQGDTLLHIPDDHGKAGEPRVLLTGFGTEDMHHAINTFRWGPDGHLYFDQGLYALSSVETPHGLRRLFGGCMWQLDTHTLDLQLFDRQVIKNNTWGHIFDAFGRQLFSSGWISDVNLVLPETPLNHSEDPSVVPPVAMTRLAGERNCGLELITGRHFPTEWQNNLITGGFHAQQVYRYAEEEGPGHVTARELPPLIVSHHAKFRPVDVKMGPDGALYVADWYNLIIQHNQVDFRDQRRDHSHGRIWRITYKGRPLVPVPDFSVPTLALLDHLKDPEQWTRNEVRRVLMERDAKDTAEQLAKWVAAMPTATDDAAVEHDLLEALWTYQTINHVEPALLSRLLHGKDARVRGAAVTVLGYWHDQVPDAVALLRAAAGDESMEVRLFAVLAAQRIPSKKAFDAALNALDHPTDPILDFELNKAALVLQPYWYPAFQSGELTFNDDAKRVAFALTAVRTGDAAPRLLTLLQSGKLPAAQQADLLVTVAAMGDAKQLGTALQTAAAPGRLRPEDQVRVLNALHDAAMKRDVAADGGADALAPLVAQEDDVGLAAIKLAGAMKLEAMRPRLVQISEDPATSAPHRQAAMAAVQHIDPAVGKPYLSKLARSADKPYAIRMTAAVALVPSAPGEAAKAAAQLLHEPTTEDTAPLFNALIRRKDNGKALADAMKDLAPTADAAKIGMRELRVAGKLSSSPLTGVLAAAADVATTNRQSSPEELKKLVSLVQSHGDPARGERIFRSATSGCMSCHAIAGAGGNVGPDLASVGTSAQVDFLIEHILAPSKHVKDGYTAYLVETKSGDSITGVQVRETADSLVLRDATHDEMVIAKNTIKKRRAVGTLMPEGLADALTDGELADLVRFLSELGRPGPFDVGHAVVERRWLVLQNVPSVDDAGERGKVLADPRVTWAIHYTDVTGHLLFSEIPGKRLRSIVVRGTLDVTAAGSLAVDVNGADGLQLWVDGVATPVFERVTLNLPVGKHTLGIWADIKARKDPSLRCELIDLPGSTGRAQWAAN